MHLRTWVWEIGILHQLCHMVHLNALGLKWWRGVNMDDVQTIHGRVTQSHDPPPWRHTRYIHQLFTLCMWSPTKAIEMNFQTGELVWLQNCMWDCWYLKSHMGGGTYLYQSIHSSYFCCTELTPFQHTLSQPKMEEYFLTPRWEDPHQ